VLAPRPRKPRSVLLHDAEIADSQRRATLVIDAEPAATPIDLDALQPVEANIVPAQAADMTAIPLRQVHVPPTIPARIRDSFEDGEAIFVLGGAAIVGVAIACVTEFILWAVTVVGAMVAVLPTILGLLATFALVLLLLGSRGKGGSDFVTVKGCPRSGTPGPIKIRR